MLTHGNRLCWLLPSILALLATPSTADFLSAAPSEDGIWLGTAPVCRASAQSCAPLDLLFGRAHSTGNGGLCWVGQKALCQFRQPWCQLASTEATRLTLVSYNVFARPYFVSHDGQRERTCRIPRALLSEVPTADVVVFQEAFLAGCLDGSEPRLSLRGLLGRYGFAHSTRTVGEGRWGLRLNGGVFVASRWPIVQEAHTVYRWSHPGSADYLANKGAVYARVNKTGTIYHVFGTHLQAQDGPKFDHYRELQAQELHRFVQSRNCSELEPVLIAGDFNADQLANGGHLRRLLGNLDATLPRRRGQISATYDPSQNDVVEAGVTARQWLDYVAFSRRHRRPSVATLRAVRLLAEAPLRMCVSAPLQPSHVAPGDASCSLAASTRHLSDHFPVVAELQFRS